MEFVFVHSYSSAEKNWEEVVLGNGLQSGRLTRACELAKQFNCPVLSNDKKDLVNISLYEDLNIKNMGTALNTFEEVRSAIELSETGEICFVSSPDHLPRVVRDAAICGATKAIFACSDVEFLYSGAFSVKIEEPSHVKVG